MNGNTTMLSMDVLDQVVELFHLHGHSVYDGLREEPVTALEHALQCAQLAEWADAPTPLVVAALLHDIGHFIAPARGSDAIDDVHELRALGLLVTAFDADVIEPIRLHVQAKRYLVSVDPKYAATLTPASMHTLGLQGGAMSPDELHLFETLPHSAQAVALRRWDDLAKQPGRRTPTLGYYLSLAENVRRSDGRDTRIAIGASDVS
jgi:phosphonate degradation associated HDIG domain protein